MNTNIQNNIDKGYLALKSANWLEARQKFEQALEQSDAPEAYDGMGIACWWLNDIQTAHQYRTAAYNGFKASQQLQKSAVIACWLAREQVFLYSNLTAMQGWFVRAESLMQHLPPCSELVWCRLFRASMLDTPVELEQVSTQSIQLAREYQDSNLEAFALAFCGLAKVIQGQVPDGMRYLDEAMVMTTGGEVSDFMVMSEIFCVMLSACETAGDLTRSEQWCRKAWEFAEQKQCPFLSAYCRTTYGSILTSMGRWQDADTVLKDALHKFEQGHRGLKIHAQIRLADLRIQQGRLHEAEVMLGGLQDHSAAVIPLARLHLAKRDVELAKALLTQALPPEPPYTLHHLAALVLMVQVLLSMEDIDVAEKLTSQLNALAQRTESKHVMAQAELTAGRIYVYYEDFVSARKCFAKALEYQKTFEQSFLAGQIRLSMAQTLQDSDIAGAIVWAKAALATFERIGSTYDSAYTINLLRELGVMGGSSIPRLQKPLTNREFEVAILVAQGHSNREISERLVISIKTVEHHVGRILNKLALRNRSEIAAFVVSGKLNEMR